MPFTSTRAYTRRHTRLAAVRTVTALAAGALVLGPATVARADTGAPHRNISVQSVQRPGPEQPPAPTPPHAAKKFPESAGAAAATGADAPLYDVDGDGKADIVGFNSAGELYRYSGTGRADATFKVRTKIGDSGWSAYTWLQ